MPAVALEPAVRSLLFYFGLCLAVVAAMLVLSWLLGGRRRVRATRVAFESGILPAGAAPLKVYVPFYRIAVFFVVFDLEAVFVFAWAVALKESGLQGIVAMTAFILVLLAALVYLWWRGALDWRTPQQRQAEIS